MLKFVLFPPLMGYLSAGIRVSFFFFSLTFNVA